MTASLAVSIINYRTPDLTIAAVDSVLSALGNREARVVIVDNASDDGSADRLDHWIDALADTRVRLVRSDENTGFSGGHNLGMAAAPGADYYLILNSDALLREGFFDVVLAEAAEHPKAGLIAPRLEWEDGEMQTNCFRLPGPFAELIRSAETGAVTRILSGHDVVLDMPPAPDQVEWASFACILLRGDMVRQIGPMDEGYFLYFEDSEYAMRARRAGWTVRFAPEARAVHLRGKSGPVKAMQAAKKRLPPYYWRSRTRFLRQAHGVAGPFLGNIAWYAGRVIAQMRRIAGKPVPRTYEAEWRDIWTGFLTPLKPDLDSRG